MPALTDNVLEVGYRLLDKVRGWLLPVPLNACGLISIQWQGLVPDFMLRPVIRALCRQRLREIDHGSFEANYAAKMEWIEGVRARSKIADLTEKANEQHYEVRVLVMLSEVPGLKCPIGPHGVHHLHPRSCRQVLVMLVSNRSGDT